MKGKDLKIIAASIPDESDVVVRWGASHQHILKTEIATLKGNPRDDGETDEWTYTREEAEKYKTHNGFDPTRLKEMEHPEFRFVTWEG